MLLDWMLVFLVCLLEIFIVVFFFILVSAHKIGVPINLLNK